MYFNWQDNSGMGNAEDTDIAMLLVYNKDKETAVMIRKLHCALPNTLNYNFLPTGKTMS